MTFWRSNSLNNRFVIWLYIIARTLLAILRQSIAKQAMTFGDHLSLNTRFAIWRILSLDPRWRFCDSLLLNKRLPLAITYRWKSESDLGNILSLNLCWRLWRRTIAKCSRAFTTIAKQAMPFGDHLSLKSESDFSNILLLNLCWRLGEQQSLSIRELVLSLNKRCHLAILYR
jgi:hypothetical protein